MTNGQEPKGWSLWDEPVFRLLMFGGFTVFTLDDALHRHGLWRIAYGIGCAFFLVGVLIEVRHLVRRRRTGRSPIE
ncbi:hypothetical protein [Phycicoccus sp. Soil803]|uniref:hypothetical protein n=1 Tax=Phycicoccus sp. Soil803 TaxID=1736415 RepID=UPI00070A92F3|nr:hypothetical protein [Phycicoccus sp. Soil803]KRF24368.1 hypothetical protein ASG95_07340 [Phycicoccus sp. Soil803]